MKTLNRYLRHSLKLSQSENIIERLKLTKDSKLITYNLFPKDFDELRSLLEQLIEERGPDANLNDIDVSQITSFGDKIKNGKHKGNYGLFYGLDPYNIDISKWNVSNVKDMGYMFKECENFDCDLSNWDVSNVEDMRYMFYGCHNFDGDLSNWDVSNVEDMHWMFQHCYSFIGQGLENWKPIKCLNMENMFGWCGNFDCDLSNWDVSNVEDMSHMFAYCINFTGQGLENWKPIKCKKIKNMFGGCTALKNKPSWYK